MSTVYRQALLPRKKFRAPFPFIQYIPRRLIARHSIPHHGPRGLQEFDIRVAKLVFCSTNMRNKSVAATSQWPMPPTLKAHVLQLLTEAIMSGRIQPGERLLENRLAEQFQVSRAPIREALHTLLEQGLVITKPRRGIFAVELQAEDLQKINSLRIVLEAEALRLCKENLTPEVEKKLEDLLLRMERNLPVPAVEAIRIDLEFHQTIWHASGNEYMEKILISLIAPLFAQWVLSLANEERILNVVLSHRPLLEFLQGKTLLSAEQVMLNLVSQTWSQPNRFLSRTLGR
jgi:DNA-binding GntR family transcriptional regulator